MRFEKWNNYKLNKQDISKFLKVNIHKITFKFISKANVDSTSLVLNCRSKALTIIPGTRRIKNFPLSLFNKSIFYWCKENKWGWRISVYPLVQRKRDKHCELTNVKLCKTSIGQKMVGRQVKLVHLPGPRKSFKWPHIDTYLIQNMYILWKSAFLLHPWK